MRDLETSFVDLTQSHFGVGLEAENELKNMRPIETSLF